MNKNKQILLIATPFLAKSTNIEKAYSSITWNSHRNFQVDLKYRLRNEENISYRKIAFSVKRFYINNIYK